MQMVLQLQETSLFLVQAYQEMELKTYTYGQIFQLELHQVPILLTAQRNGL